MTDFTALCEAVANRKLGALGEQLGAAFAAHFPAAQIDKPLRIAHFAAQTGQETGGYQWMHELGNQAYFAKYDGRADLGNSQPGDGFRFRGRGLVMLTGRANYQSYGKKLGLDLVGDPDLAMEPDAATAIACAYWIDHGLNALADADDIVGITRRINGGLTGLSDRQTMLARAKTFLDVA